jgi:cobalt-zinc-cadmium resistance protein CzcA
VCFAELIIPLVLPFASIGGIAALYITGEYLSVPASVGFIALWGIAVLNGGVLVSYIRSLRETGMVRRQAILEGAKLRFRPVMMTATDAALGLVVWCHDIAYKKFTEFPGFSRKKVSAMW